jgi:hypothetical protein
MDEAIADTYLVSGNITVFCGYHAASFKSDILNTSLYAQLVAAQRGIDRESYWSAYTEILSKLCGPANSRAFQRMEFDCISLLGIAEQCAGSLLPANERRALANAFLQIIQLKSDSPAVNTFIRKLRASTSSTGDTTTLLTIVRQDKTLITLQIAFATDEIAIDVLDQPVLKAAKDGKTNIRLLRSSLDESHYSPFRAEIIKKLGQKIETDLLHIQSLTA